MTWTFIPFGNEYHAESLDADGNGYRAFVLEGDESWCALVRVRVGPCEYTAASHSAVLDSPQMAQIWAEAALLQLQAVTRQLGDTQ